MIKPLNIPHLSSAKPRSGLQSIAELLPRLIRQYEIQAELRQRQTASSISPLFDNASSSPAPCRQATFAWYD